MVRGERPPSGPSAPSCPQVCAQVQTGNQLSRAPMNPHHCLHVLGRKAGQPPKGRTLLKEVRCGRSWSGHVGSGRGRRRDGSGVPGQGWRRG
jgi:hypothetical protein